MKRKDYKETCARCKKEFMQTQLGGISDAIMQHKPACGYKCNLVLGQVYKSKGT